MLIDAINHRAPAGATENTVIGPFYVKDPPERRLGEDISGGWPGTKMKTSRRHQSAGNNPMRVGNQNQIFHILSNHKQTAICQTARKHPQGPKIEG